MNIPFSVLFPVIVSAEATNNMSVVREMVYRGTRLCVLISLPCWVLFAVFAEPLFRWYLGAAYQDVTSFVPFLAATMFFSSATSVIRLIPVPMGKPLFISVAELAFGLVNIAITVVLVGWYGWGLPGVAFGTLIAVGIKNILLQPWYVAWLVKLDLLTLSRETLYAVVPTVISGLAMTGLGGAFTGMDTVWLAIPAGVVLVLFFVSFYAIGLPSGERQRVKVALTVAWKAIS